MSTLESIRTIQIGLNANAASLPSSLGGGQQVHLGLTISRSEYQTFTGHTFICPANQGITPSPGTACELPVQCLQHCPVQQINSGSG
eukprot:3842554-Ditylum_brightwellii.AAC.1